MNVVHFSLCGFIIAISVELILVKNSLNRFRITYEKYHILWKQLVNFTYFQNDHLELISLLGEK